MPLPKHSLGVKLSHPGGVIGKYLVIETLARQIEVVFTMKYYIMPEFFGVWSKLMMSKAGPPGIEFYAWSLSLTFLTGIVLAVFYDFIKSLLCKDFWWRVLCFTKIIVVLMLFFSYLPMWLMINLPTGLVWSWFITSVITSFLGAMVFVKILK